ncbi:lysophospholipase [Paenibacillus sp. HN-1]|nr:lysophospholipase [Paenibacillus sp. CGMCC 1.18879]MBY9083586.1 lysophospholipase [Paenibacillus sinensis]
MLVFGFIYAAQDVIYPKGAASAEALPENSAAPGAETSGKLRIAAVGDSLAKGTGDDKGEGFVRRAVAGLSSSGTPAELVGNLGINGLTTAGLQAKLKEQGVKYVLEQADIILVSIGGNDLFQGAQSMLNEASGSGGSAEAGGSAGSGGAASGSSGRGSAGTTSSSGSAYAAPGSGNEAGSNTAAEGETADSGRASSGEVLQDLDPAKMMGDIPAASKRLETVLNGIEAINPKAKIYYVGLYNPFGDIEEMLQPGNEGVTAWNSAALDIINRHPNMTLVPTFDLFGGHLDKYLSSDHFHPNGDGYQRMADRIVQAIR